MGEERLCIKYPVHRWFPVANLTLYRSAIIYESHMPGKSSLSIWLSGIFKLIHYFPPSFIIIMKWHIPQSILKCKCSTPRHFTCWTSARCAVVSSVLIVRISVLLWLNCRLFWSFSFRSWPTPSCLYSFYYKNSRNYNNYPALLLLKIIGNLSIQIHIQFNSIPPIYL